MKKSVHSYYRVVLPKLQHLRHLNVMDHSSSGAQSMRNWKDATMPRLHDITGLYHLELKCEVTDPEIMDQDLVEYFRASPQLTFVNMQHKSEGSMAVVGPALGRLSALQEQDMTHSFLGSQGIKTLLSHIQPLTSPHRLGGLASVGMSLVDKLACDRMCGAGFVALGKFLLRPSQSVAWRVAYDPDWVQLPIPDSCGDSCD